MGDLIQSLANFLNIEDLKVRYFNFSQRMLNTKYTVYCILDDGPFPKHNRQIESILWTDQWLWDYIHKSHFGCCTQEIYCEKCPYPGRRCSLVQWVIYALIITYLHIIHDLELLLISFITDMTWLEYIRIWIVLMRIWPVLIGYDSKILQKCRKIWTVSIQFWNHPSGSDVSSVLCTMHNTQCMLMNNNNNHLQTK